MPEAVITHPETIHLDETLVQETAHPFTHDLAAFRQKMPFTVIPTNLPGAYATPAPPANFDPKAASQLDLIRYGLLWRKPTETDTPEIHAAWNTFFSRTWLEKDRIVPHSVPQIGVTHRLTQVPQKHTDGTYTSSMWAGAGGRTGKWTGVIGYWHIPTVSKPTEAQGTEGGWNSSSWIGIDGFFNSNDVLQAGIQQRVNAAGVASYVAWYEWYSTPVAGSPGYVWQTNIANFDVSPGQQVYCSVQYVNNNTAGTLYFANQTTGQHFSITLAPPPGANFSGSSYEWIVEAPDGGEPKSSLPRFTPVTFTSAIACGPNGASANPLTGDIINIVGQGKTLTSTTIGSQTTTVSFIG